MAMNWQLAHDRDRVRRKPPKQWRTTGDGRPAQPGNANEKRAEFEAQLAERNQLRMLVERERRRLAKKS